MRVEKYVFIAEFLTALNKTLAQELKDRLPEGDSFLFELQDEAWEIIVNRAKHIKGGIQ